MREARYHLTHFDCVICGNGCPQCNPQHHAKCTALPEPPSATVSPDRVEELASLLQECIFIVKDYDKAVRAIPAASRLKPSTLPQRIETALAAYRSTTEAPPSVQPVACKECEKWRTWGIIEIAVRNPSVSEYMNHWEGRAEKAETELSRLRASASSKLQEVQKLHDTELENLKNDKVHYSHDGRYRANGRIDAYESILAILRKDIPKGDKK